MAYPLAAAITGWLAERGFDRRYLTSSLAMLAGLCTMFAGGVLWLAFFARGAANPRAALERPSPPVSIRSSLPDLVKVACASLVLPGVWKLGRGQGSVGGATSAASATEDQEVLILEERLLREQAQPRTCRVADHRLRADALLRRQAPGRRLRA